MRTCVVTAASGVLAALLTSPAQAGRFPCPLGQYFRPSIGICQHHQYEARAAVQTRHSASRVILRRPAPAVRVVVRTRYRTVIKVVRVAVPVAPVAPVARAVVMARAAPLAHVTPMAHVTPVARFNPVARPVAPADQALSSPAATVTEPPRDIAPPPAPPPVLWAGKLSSAPFGPPIRRMPSS